MTTTNPSRRGCFFYVRRIAKWTGITLLVLILAGVAYQLVVTEIDRRNYAVPGQLYEVNGKQMHLNCMGEGSPTVILESGGFSFSIEWYWVQQQLAKTNRVCAYDRAGAGWSEASDQPRTAYQIVEELHTLLDVADVPAPYVLVGHSFGGIMNRVYAAQYPDDVVGMVLVDTAFLLPEKFASQAEFDQWKRDNDVLQAMLWALIRTGLGRVVIGGEIQAMGYPPEIAAAFTAFKSTNQSFDTYYAEAIPARQSLHEASYNARDLGNMPFIVLWAEKTTQFKNDADQQLFNKIADDVEHYSTNGETRIIAGSDHGSIIGNEAYAQQVSDAVLDVIND